MSLVMLCLVCTARWTRRTVRPFALVPGVCIGSRQNAGQRANARLPRGVIVPVSTVACTAVPCRLVMMPGFVGCRTSWFDRKQFLDVVGVTRMDYRRGRVGTMFMARRGHSESMPGMAKSACGTGGGTLTGMPRVLPANRGTSGGIETGVS